MRTLRFSLSLLTLLMLGACGESAGPSISTINGNAAAINPPSPPARALTVGLVMKTLTNPFFIEMEKGARRAADDLGVALQLKTGAEETSIEQQIQIIDDLIVAGVDAMVIAPGDSKRLVPSLKKAADAGIRLVNIDNPLDPEAVSDAGLAPVPLISVDNEQAAYASARFIADGSRPGTQAAIIEGIRSADNSRQRLQGARRAFADSRVTVVATESANWKIDEGYTVTRQLFAKRPGIRLIFAANDMMALGALKFLKESGRSNVKVAAYDALPEAVAEVEAGRLAATVDQQAQEQGYQGVTFAVKLLRNEAVAPRTLIETRLLTQAASK